MMVVCLKILITMKGRYKLTGFISFYIYTYLTSASCALNEHLEINCKKRIISMNHLKINSNQFYYFEYCVLKV